MVRVVNKGSNSKEIISVLYPVSIYRNMRLSYCHIFSHSIWFRSYISVFSLSVSCLRIFSVIKYTNQFTSSLFLFISVDLSFPSFLAILSFVLFFSFYKFFLTLPVQSLFSNSFVQSPYSTHISIVHPQYRSPGTLYLM